MKLFQALEENYWIRIGLDTVNRLELIISSKRGWRNKEIKMIIFSDEKRAGMINIGVKPLVGNYRNNRPDGFSLELWETAAEVLRFSLAGQEAKQKCWNCFEEIDFRDNFCKHCGKS